MSAVANCDKLDEARVLVVDDHPSARQSMADVLTHAVVGRVGAGHDGAMSRQGKGHRAGRVGEANPLFRQPVDVRCVDTSAAIARDSVGP